MCINPNDDSIEREYPAQMIQEMRQMDKRFKLVCRQLVLMNNQIAEVKKRYERAVANNRRSFRYQHRLRLVTLEGVRNMFWEYAQDRADRLDDMQDKLMEDYDIDWDDVAEEEDDIEMELSIQTS